MKKTATYIFSILALCMAMLLPVETALAADITISASKSSVNIGDSVTVTVTVPENISGTLDVIYPTDLLEFSKASAEVNASKAGTIAISIGKYGLVTSNTLTITFKAKTAGTATVKTKGIDFFDNNGETDNVVLGDSSTKITIKNETSTEDTLSSDYYLAKLNITAGSKSVSLSPSFKYSKTNYTATVDYDVTSVVVSATRSSGKSEIVSITDNGNVQLEVGSNVIEIVVKAENGKTLTYKITITRKEKAAETQQPSGPTETENPTPATPDFELNGVALYVPEEIPESKIPEGFNVETTILNGNKELPCLSFAKGELLVFYLENESKVGAFYVYNAADNNVYPFVKLLSEENYVMVLMPDDETAPEGYTACTLSLEGKGIVNAYQYQGAGDTDLSDFYLIYCMNNNGTIGWYQYDSLEETYQRYTGIVSTGTTTPDIIPGTTPGTEDDTESETVAGGNDDTKVAFDWKEYQTVIICVIVFLGAIVAIIIINILLAKHRKNSAEDDEEDDEEYEDFDDKEVFKKEIPVDSKKTEEKTSETESEVSEEEKKTEEKEELPEDNKVEDDEVEFIDL